MGHDNFAGFFSEYFFFIFSFFYFSWAMIILGIFFLNKIFFMFLYFCIFAFFFFFFDWQRLATIHLFLLRQKQTFRGPYKLNGWLRQNLIKKKKININSVLRRISLFAEFQSREWHILLTDAFFPISIWKEWNLAYL